MKKYFFIFFILIGSGAYAQVITTIAGITSGGSVSDGGPATAAKLHPVTGVVVDKKGNLYLSSWHLLFASSHRVRKVDPSGIINAFAGTDTSGFSGDGGPATLARLYFPEHLGTDKYGNVYIADRGNKRIRKVDTFGIITTFAGNGSAAHSGDGGPATSAGISICFGVCCDTADNVYISGSGRIRKVAPSGIITTIAGTGVAGDAGDGGPATAAQLYGQGQITIDLEENIYFCDGGNARIRKINSAGIITTIAGTGVTGYSGDGGIATAAKINGPNGLCVDSCENVYIADKLNHRIRVINGAGIIKTFAGDGTGGYGGDGGPATAAKLFQPVALCMDKNSSIYVADNANARVRYIHMDSCRNTVGIAQAALTQGEEVLRIWPNPSSGAFSLRLSATVNEHAEVLVTNVMGEVVKQFSSATNKDTEVILYTPPGVYFVTVSTASGKWVQKVLVE